VEATDDVNATRQATEAGRPPWRVVEVSGDEALAWLDRLVTADIAGLAPGEALRSLLLSPTGGVLASFTVVGADGRLYLFQDAAEPRSIGELLDRYVLSSDVQLSDRSGDPAVPVEPPAGDAPAEAQRIERGIPRVGTDTADGDLPAEAGLDGLVSYDKGCFLGQEAVAKARNLGHPRRVLIRLGSDRPVRAGDPVRADGVVAGRITSATTSGDGTTMALATIAWNHREAELRTGDGALLRVRA
jgi:tRNA-modifying protein YgfZ